MAACAFSWPTVADEADDIAAPKIIDILDARKPAILPPKATRPAPKPKKRIKEDPLHLKFPRQPIAAPGTMWLQANGGNNGTPTTLENYRGRWVVLNLWATWCAPCVAEMPTLDKLHRRYNQAGLDVIAINVDKLQGPGVNIADIERFYRQVGVKYLPVHVDPEAHMPYSMRVQKLPTTFIINPDGFIIAAADGAEDWFGGPMKRFMEPRLKSLQDIANAQTPEPKIRDIFQ